MCETTVRATACISAFMAALTILGAGLYGQQGQLSSKYYALRMDAHAEPGHEGWVQKIASELHARAIQDDMAKRYRIVLLERPDSMSPEAFGARIKKVVAKNVGIKSVQVYGSGSKLSIPTGQIIVVFKDGTPSSEARELLSQSGVKIVGEPTKLLPEQFVVEPQGSTDAAQLATKLALDPRVHFTEPDLLQVSVP